MNGTLQELVTSRGFSGEEVSRRTTRIYQTMLDESRHLDAGNFTQIHTTDLSRSFDLYDREFFEGLLRQTLENKPLGFRLSRRMTSAGGKTGQFMTRSPLGKSELKGYEITISTTLLFQTFQTETRPIRVTGILCEDRLQALQRIIEHELVHLTEMLVWTKSSCRAQRFQQIATNFFGHTEHTHQLITPREHARTEYGLQPGDRVTFRFEGRHYQGFINRITRRATVLVEDPQGVRYSNGCHYKKFYVPVSLLERQGDSTAID